MDIKKFQPTLEPKIILEKKLPEEMSIEFVIHFGLIANVKFIEWGGYKGWWRAQSPKGTWVIDEWWVLL